MKEEARFESVLQRVNHQNVTLNFDSDGINSVMYYCLWWILFFNRDGNDIKCRYKNLWNLSLFINNVQWEILELYLNIEASFSWGGKKKNVNIEY